MEPLDDVAVAVDQELGEVPLDVAWLLGSCQAERRKRDDFDAGFIVGPACGCLHLNFLSDQTCLLISHDLPLYPSAEIEGRLHELRLLHGHD